MKKIYPASRFYIPPRPRPPYGSVQRKWMGAFFSAVRTGELLNARGIATAFKMEIGQINEGLTRLEARRYIVKISLGAYRRTIKPYIPYRKDR